MLQDDLVGTRHGNGAHSFPGDLPVWRLVHLQFGERPNDKQRRVLTSLSR